MDLARRVTQFFECAAAVDLDGLAGLCHRDCRLKQNFGGEVGVAELQAFVGGLIVRMDEYADSAPLHAILA